MGTNRTMRGAWGVLLLAAALGTASTGPAAATVPERRSVKKVKLTLDIAPPVRLTGTKGQCLLTTDGYNIDFEGEDYPSLGVDGGLASGGPGPATDPDQERQYTAFSATIDGASYVEDDSGGLDAINSAVTLNLKKRTIRFEEYPIIAVETQEPATMSGIVKCA